MPMEKKLINRPQQIRRPHVYGNWRPEKREKHKSSASRRPGNDAAHLEAVRKLPCCVCLSNGPSDPHHLKGSEAAGPGERCFGRRSSDKYTVPLCRICHEDAQIVRGENESEYFRERGIEDVYEFAKAMFGAPKEDSAMMRIFLAHITM